MKNLISFAVFVIILTFTSYSLSFSTTSTPKALSETPNNGQQIHSAPDTSYQQTNHQKENTHSPMVGLSSDTEKSKQEPPNYSTKVNDKKETEWWLVYFTGALVFVGVLQFLTLIIQARQFWQTNKVMRNTTHMQLRAYVCVSGGTIKFDRKDAPVAHVEYRNSGQTPAYDVQGWHHIWIAGYPLTEELPEPSKSFMTSHSIIPPGGHAFMLIPKKPSVPAQSVHLLGTPEGTIYIYGEIRYKDAFGVERLTKYRFMYGGPEGVHGAYLKPHTEGNEAN